MATIALAMLAGCDVGGGPECVPSTLYRDADGDGHGSPTETTSSCGPMPGYVASSDDCDDDVADRAPGAPERCDGVDQDCDGVVDDMPIDGIAYFLDADADGFGGSPAVIACRLPGVGYTRVGGDCDDTRTDIRPGATEVPYDLIDQDCDPTTRDDDLDADGYLHAVDCNDRDAAVTPATVPPAFTDVTAASGIVGARAATWPVSPFCWENGSASVAAADVDDDGDVDLFLGRIGLRDQLYLNRGDGVFDEVAVQRGIDHVGSSAAALFFDAEGDGDLDLVVGSSGNERMRFYRNAGSATFTEVGASVGLDLPPIPGTLCAMTFGLTATDLDFDGDLDLVVGTYRDFFTAPKPSRVLANDGSGVFTDVTASSPLAGLRSAVMSLAFHDLDDDGTRDAIVVGDWQSSTAYRFTRDPYGATELDANFGFGTDHYGMGLDVADVDGDDDLDLFVTAISSPNGAQLADGFAAQDGNRLYLSEGGRLVDATDRYGVRDGGWGWSAAFFDLDLDGDLDLANENGWDYAAFATDTMRLFVNGGAPPWHDVGCVAGFPADQGRALLPFDMDGDGDLDLLRTSDRGAPSLHRNDLPSGRSWIGFALEDSRGPNRQGIGSVVRVRVEPGQPFIRREVHLDGLVGVVRPPWVHLGLGARSGPVAEVQVTWPDGASTSYFDLSTGTRHRLTR